MEEGSVRVCISSLGTKSRSANYPSGLAKKRSESLPVNSDLTTLSWDWKRPLPELRKPLNHLLSRSEEGSQGRSEVVRGVHRSVAKTLGGLRSEGYLQGSFQHGHRS